MRPWGIHPCLGNPSKLVSFLNECWITPSLMFLFQILTLCSYKIKHDKWHPLFYVYVYALVVQMVKNPTCNVGDLGSIPGLGRSSGEGKDTHSSILAWRIPMDREAWQATVHGVPKSQTQLSDFHSLICIHVLYITYVIYLAYIKYKCGASKVMLAVKNPPANAGDTGDSGSIPGSGSSPGEGNGNPLQYPCLGNSMNRGAWWATDHGAAKNWTQLSKWTHTNINIHINTKYIL